MCQRRAGLESALRSRLGSRRDGKSFLGHILERRPGMRLLTKNADATPGEGDRRSRTATTSPPATNSPSASPTVPRWLSRLTEVAIKTERQRG